jgi:hypothetical protein
MKSGLRFKFLTGFFAAALVFAAGWGVVSAATSDPYVNTYEYNAVQEELIPRRTFIFANDALTTEIFFSPTSIDAATADPSYFDSEADAAAVTGEVLLDSPLSLNASTNVDVIPTAFVDDDWLAFIGVELSDDASFGSLSVKLTNPGASAPDNSFNVTILRQEADPPQYTSVGGIEVRLYDPGSTAVYASTGMTVANADFHENPDRTFPTAMDGLFQAYYYVPPVQGNVTNIVTYDDVITGYLVTSMTVSGVTYSITGTMGWQYRVYRGSPAVPVSLSEVVGADSFMLQSGDVIVWAYGGYGSGSLFPPHLDLPKSE